MRAEDEDGQWNDVSVRILVSDINDVEPEFTHLPYSFRVDEGKQDVALGEIKVILFN